MVEVATFQLSAPVTGFFDYRHFDTPVEGKQVKLITLMMAEPFSFFQIHDSSTVYKRLTGVTASHT